MRRTWLKMFWPSNAGDAAELANEWLRANEGVDVIRAQPIYVGEDQAGHMLASLPILITYRAEDPVGEEKSCS